MNETQSLISSLLVCGVALATASTLSAQTTKEELAKVVRVQGTARYMPPGGGWQDVQRGTVLKPGSVLQTDIEKGSYVDVVLGIGTGFVPGFGSGDYRKIGPVTTTKLTTYTGRTGQTVVRVFENTVLGVDKLLRTETGAAAVMETELDLRNGHILGNVKKLTAGSTFNIRYPKGVAAIRGSVFDMRVEQRREPVQGVPAGTNVVHCTFSMSEGTAVITFTLPDGTTITETVETMQGWDSGTPTTTSTIPPEVWEAIQRVLTQLSVPPIAIARALNPDLTIVQEVTTTTGGEPPGNPGGGPEVAK
ncbi:MAG: hypothetical protein ABSF95_05620 [Verrucomicrobiota bacterium]|jgi:hypothetical protein